MERIDHKIRRARVFTKDNFIVGETMTEIRLKAKFSAEINKIYDKLYKWWQYEGNLIELKQLYNDLFLTQKLEAEVTPELTDLYNQICNIEYY